MYGVLVLSIVARKLAYIPAGQLSSHLTMQLLAMCGDVTQKFVLQSYNGVLPLFDKGRKSSRDFVKWEKILKFALVESKHT